MTKTHWTVVVLVAAGAGIAAVAPMGGQNPVDSVVENLAARATRFLDGISPESTASAYEELLRSSPLAGQTQAIEAMVVKTNELENRYGACRGLERVTAQRVGADLVLLRFLYKCENFPVVWHFTFYRTASSGIATQPDGDWRVITVRFDTDVEQLGLLPPQAAVQ